MPLSQLGPRVCLGQALFRLCPESNLLYASLSSTTQLNAVNLGVKLGLWGSSSPPKSILSQHTASWKATGDFVAWKNLLFIEQQLHELCSRSSVTPMEFFQNGRALVLESSTRSHDENYDDEISDDERARIWIRPRINIIKQTDLSQWADTWENTQF